MAQMEFVFDANQEHQTEAIDAVVSLFDGQSPLQAEMSPFELGIGYAVPNGLELSDDDLLTNLQQVQEQNEIEQDPLLQMIEDDVENSGDPLHVQFPNFTVEMETGTGKTYVYLRTAFELFRRYGMRKFIVVVPSIAIKEGVLKTLQITKKHFAELYDNPSYNWYEYNSDNLTQVRAFAEDQNMQIMVMTLASFNRAANVIRQSPDRLNGGTPLHMIQETHPILILDEPQNMETPKSKKALASLNPLCALRYSATPRNRYNLVYQLSPYEAYRRNLVKRIEVAGVAQVDDTNTPFIRLDGITVKKETIRAKLTVQKLRSSGQVSKAKVTVKLDDNLEQKANRKDYAEYTVEMIDPRGGYITFTTGLELQLGEEVGPDQHALWDAQIRYAINEHVRKARRLRKDNIKVLTLFFIDRVANYTGDDSVIRRLFDQAFCDIAHNGYAREIWGEADIDPERVQEAYFAERRTKAGETILEDSKTGEAVKDQQAYDLIMRNKEKLLSFEEPVSFIFSHSALREGWDNPNVFQICTLNQTVSDMKKRQEIGRGVRLCVDQDGNRCHDEAYNVLTVVANESYEDYVMRLQSEYDEEYGAGNAPPKPADTRKRQIVRLQKARKLSDEFRSLWEKIKHKTRYSVGIDTAELLRDVRDMMTTERINPPRIEVTKAQVNIDSDEGFVALQMARAKTVAELQGRYPVPNIISLMEDLLERSAPPLRMSRHTLLEVYRQSSDQQKEAAMDNPHEFARIAVSAIKRALAQQYIGGIRYERTGEWYEMTQFQEELQSFAEIVLPVGPDSSLYDHIICDSLEESTFAQILEERDDVKIYVKLPAWFTVDTPLGTYNPDWAILLDERDAHGVSTGEKLYLVRETKGTNDPRSLTPSEYGKIQCGEAHFNEALEDVEYTWGTAEELLD